MCDNCNVRLGQQQKKRSKHCINIEIRSSFYQVVMIDVYRYEWSKLLSNHLRFVCNRISVIWLHLPKISTVFSYFFQLGKISLNFRPENQKKHEFHLKNKCLATVRHRAHEIFLWSNCCFSFFNFYAPCIRKIVVLVR